MTTLGLHYQIKTHNCMVQASSSFVLTIDSTGRCLALVHSPLLKEVAIR